MAIVPAVLLAVITIAAAEETKTATTAPPPVASPYMLPFQLRGAAVGKSLRLDTAIAFYDTAMGASPTYASFFSVSYNLSPDLALFARVAYLNGNQNATDRGGVFSNPAFGAVYLLKLSPDLRLAAMFGFTLPIGGGGGDTPVADSKAARTAAVLARSAMDNTILSSNDFGVFPGLDIAWVKYGLTLQAEATLNIVFRTQGELDQPDENKLNLTAGVFAGYFVMPWLSLGSELRFQRWLKPPKAVDTAMNRDALMSQLSFAVGPRFHIELADKVFLRPALVYARGIDEPMSAAGYDVIQIDLPLTF
jgi:hypothetical protein